MNATGQSKGESVKISGESMKDKLAKALKMNMQKSQDRLSNMSTLSQKQKNQQKEREEYEAPMKQLYWNTDLLPALNNSYNNSKIPGYQYNHFELNWMQKKLLNLSEQIDSFTGNDRQSNLNDLSSKFDKI